MKKTYINPEMQVVEINTPVLLTGSLPVFDTEITKDDMLSPELELGNDDFVLFDE